MDELPNLQKIIYFEDRGVVSYKEDILMSWDDFLAIGKEEYEKTMILLHQEWKKLNQAM